MRNTLNHLYKKYKEALRGFHQRINKELTILLYHGVTDINSKGIENYSTKHIAQDDFRQQMKYLRDNCNVISIDDFLVARKRGEGFPSRSVIISFDDGFRNNYTVAVPILEEYRLPAVFYISSGIVNKNLMFWVDVIEDCLNLVLKPSIKIDLDRPVEFSLKTTDEKITALEVIKAYCKNSRQDEKNRVIDDIQNITGIEASVEHSPNYEKITWRELRQMHDNNLFIIGGHSLYHQILSYLNEQEAEWVIRSSLDLLQLNLNATIRHYSYPEGQPHHYNSRTIDILKKHAVVCCPSAVPGLNSIDTDPFHLRRIMVGFSNIPFPFWDRSI